GQPCQMPARGQQTAAGSGGNHLCVGKFEYGRGVDDHHVKVRWRDLQEVLEGPLAQQLLRVGRLRARAEQLQILERWNRRERVPQAAPSSEEVGQADTLLHTK